MHHHAISTTVRAVPEFIWRVSCSSVGCLPVVLAELVGWDDAVVAADKLTVKDRTTLKRDRGQTGLDTRVWKSETEMQLRQQYD